MDAPESSWNNCGCAGAGEVRCHIVLKSSDGREHSLVVSQGKVVLANDNSSTTIRAMLAEREAAVLTLGLEDDSAIEAVDGSLQITGTKTPFVIERVPGSDDLFRLRTKEGLYLHAPQPGAPIILALSPGKYSDLKFVNDVAPAPDRPRREPEPDFEPREFAANPGAWDNEAESTHLWIFNRACSVIRKAAANSNKLAKNQSSLLYYLFDRQFSDAVRGGIDAADNTGLFDKETSGFIFSAHFYDPIKQRGGWWDPHPEINALEYGVRYFGQALTDDNAEDSGRHLGLAIHYLQDLCQPMHCGLYPNQPGDSSYGFRHENYEEWILSIQQRYELAVHELHLEEFRFDDIKGWWEFTAKAGYREYQEWAAEGLYSTSPIGFRSYGSIKLSTAEAAREAHDNWLPSTGRMLSLAQRLTAGLLIAWADAPAKLISNLLITHQAEDLLIADALHNRCAVAGDVDDGNIYHQLSEGRQNARWKLESVLKDGQPVYSTANDQKCPVFYIKDLKHNKYLVAGDVADSHVYHQPHQNRLNAQWALEPVTGPDRKPSYMAIAKPTDSYDPKPAVDMYPLQRIRDMKHGLYLVAGDKADNHVYHQPHQNRLNAQWALNSKLPF